MRNRLRNIKRIYTKGQEFLFKESYLERIKIGSGGSELKNYRDAGGIEYIKKGLIVISAHQILTSNTIRKQKHNKCSMHLNPNYP